MRVDVTSVGALRMRLLRGIPPLERKPIVTFAQLHPVHAERMRDRATRGSSIRFGLETPPRAFDYREDEKFLLS